MKDFRQCYTCKKVFDGYYNLMDHRKASHPSNKKCRYYPTNCKFGSNCWYVHEEVMEVDTTLAENNICNSASEGSSSLKLHQDKDHVEKITVSQSSLSKQPPQNFQQILEIFPPDHFMKMFHMMKDLTRHFEIIGKTFKEILN